MYNYISQTDFIIRSTDLTDFVLRELKKHVWLFKKKLYQFTIINFHQKLLSK